MYAERSEPGEKIAEARRLDQYGIDCAVLTGAQLRELEPHVSEKIVGAIHFGGSPTSTDPDMLTQAYADLFVRKGGHFLKGDARRLAQDAPGWSLPAEYGPVSAREAVVALGPWSDDVFRPLGYDIPLAVKRGYHMHYGVQGNATLGHPLHDADGGYVLVPMRKGIRLTAGVEFAERVRSSSPATNRSPANCFRSESAGGGPLAGEASLPPRHGTGDRAWRAPPQPVVRLRPHASRLQAETSQRQTARRDDDRRDALYRSVALRGSPIFELSVASDPDRHPHFISIRLAQDGYLGLQTTWRRQGRPRPGLLRTYLDLKMGAREFGPSCGATAPHRLAWPHPAAAACPSSG
jgi:hypothetical protein